ncbi:hypothetical protein [Brevibacillus centrosporus]|uniref:hypothetical protein n=1 Tax=Brevibacillus centrosporus TaxID=54910 RepID=UPI0039888923
MARKNGETISVERVNVPFFVAVYCFGGRISAIEISNDLLFLWREMKKNLALGFHGEMDDDARIFNQHCEEVYFYNEDEELVELYCSACLLIHNRAKDQEAICGCGTMLIPLLLDVDDQS